MLKIAIIAGEPSGDMLGGKLIEALKAQSKVPIKFMGIGGEHMIATGFISAYDMSILSIGGYGFDVIRAIPKIYWMYWQITKAIIAFKPDVFIGIDAPDFNFHIERKLKKYGIKTVHYISPTIWAWRYERIFKIKQSTDLMLCAFPMEAPLYEAENIKAKYVGHYLADQIELDVDTEYYKKKLGLDGKIFTILVGSRKSEINSLAHIFIETISLLNQNIPDAIFLLPLPNQRIASIFAKIIADAKVNFSYKILIDQTSDAIKASDMVLAKSGTVTLEVALAKKPLIISYKVSQFTKWLIARKLKIKYVGLPNILLNEEVAKELLQDDATAKNLAKNFLELFYNKDKQQYMISKFYQLHNILKMDANNTAAKAILELIHGN